MIRKDTEPDPQPKWLRPIDPLVAASLPIRIDPPLGVDEATADRLRRDAEPLLTIVTVFVTSNYNNVLAAEVTDDAEHGLHVLVRAATDDEGLPAVFGRRGARRLAGERRPRHHLAAG